MPTIQKCKVIKGVYVQNNVIIDSAEFIYNDTLLVRTKLMSGEYFTFEYSNNKLVRRVLFLKDGTQSVVYTNFVYDAENNLTVAEGYAGTHYRYIEFMYSSGKLMKVTDKSYSSFYGNSTDYEYTYSYTGDNITQSTILKAPGSSNPQTIIVKYTYDTLENYFKKWPNSFLVEPYFFRKECTLFPYFFSKNNIAGIQYNGAANSPQNWKTNSSGYILENFSTDGRTGWRYEYECK